MSSSSELTTADAGTERGRPGDLPRALAGDLRADERREGDLPRAGDLRRVGVVLRAGDLPRVERVCVTASSLAVDALRLGVTEGLRRVNFAPVDLATEVRRDEDADGMGVAIRDLVGVRNGVRRADNCEAT